MLVSELRFTCRMLRSRPWTSIAVIVSLILGVGASTAAFSVINAVLLRPVPVYQPARVVRVYATVKKTGATMGISYPEFLDWKTQCRSLEAIAVIRAFSFYTTDAQRPEHLKGAGISASGFRVFGVSMSLGRGFTEDEDKPGGTRVAILSHRLWEKRFGRDSTVLGRTLSLDGKEYTIVGVMQATQVNILQYPDVWVPNGPFLDTSAMRRDLRAYFPAARLKPTATPAEAQTELETVAGRLADKYPASNKDIGVRLVGLTELLTANDRRPAVLLFGTALLILLLTTLNVVMVLTYWAIGRRNELAVRMSLGASRFQLVRQLFLKAFLLITAGSALGLIAAKVTLAFFLYRFPNALIRFQETSFDHRVYGFSIVIVLVAATFAAVLPGWYASRLDIGNQLRGSRDSTVRHHSTLTASLITFEIAVSACLLLIAGLLLKSLNRAANVDLGFNPHHTLSFQIDLPAQYKPADQALFFRRSLGLLSASPGLSKTSAISSLPLTTQANALRLESDKPSSGTVNPILVEDEAVLPGFFATLQVPVLQGREFTDRDSEAAPPVAIVDDVLASSLWPGESPIGKRIRLIETSGSQSPGREVVGVVREIRHFGPEVKVRWMQVYVPEYQDPSPIMSFVMNTDLPLTSVQSQVEKRIGELDSNLPVDNFVSMDDLFDSYLSGRKVTVCALAFFASIAVFLAVIGIYGVVANLTIARHRELAIRCALGATPGKTLFLVLKTSFNAALAGLALGLALVASLSRIITSFLFDVDPLDSTVYIVTAVSILLLTVAASVIPAATALYLQPNAILRE
jgi:putative ABC transport system permease protein